MFIKKFFFLTFLISSTITNVYVNKTSAALTQQQYENIAELVNAYTWAHSKWVTTMRDFNSARMYDWLTRWELAKMMSVYIEKMWINRSFKNWHPNYKDVNNSLWDLAYYINRAYQYNIMWVDANGNQLEYFNPYWKVSRAEFWTVFSRVLYWNQYNKSWSNFYENHLKALKNAKIMNFIENPSQYESRWLVMLMMMRTDSSFTPRNINDKSLEREVNKIIENSNNNNNTSDTIKNNITYSKMISTPWNLEVSVQDEINWNYKISSNTEFMSINLDYENYNNRWSDIIISTLTFKTSWNIWKSDISLISLESEDGETVWTDIYRINSNEFEIDIKSNYQQLRSKYNTWYLILDLDDSSTLNSEWLHDLWIKLTRVDTNADHVIQGDWFNKLVYYSYDIESKKDFSWNNTENNTNIISDSKDITSNESNNSNTNNTSSNTTDNTSSNMSDTTDSTSLNNQQPKVTKHLFVTWLWQWNEVSSLDLRNNSTLNLDFISFSNSQPENIENVVVKLKLLWNIDPKYIKSIWIGWKNSSAWANANNTCSINKSINFNWNSNDEILINIWTIKWNSDFQCKLQATLENTYEDYNLWLEIIDVTADNTEVSLSNEWAPRTYKVKKYYLNSSNWSNSSNNKENLDNNSSDSEKEADNKELSVNVKWLFEKGQAISKFTNYINFASIELNNQSNNDIKKVTVSFSFSMSENLKRYQYVKSVWINGWTCWIDKMIDINDLTTNDITIDFWDFESKTKCYFYIGFWTNWRYRDQYYQWSVRNIKVTSENFKINYNESWEFGWTIGLT